jgi:hypothetical protein
MAVGDVQKKKCLHLHAVMLSLFFPFYFLFIFCLSQSFSLYFSFCAAASKDFSMSLAVEFMLCDNIWYL